MARAAGRERRGCGGRIVTLSDLARGQGPARYKGYLPYSSPAGVRRAEARALELAQDQIWSTRSHRPHLRAGHLRRKFASVERATPLGRWAAPGEIAKTILALIESDLLRETIRVDGGRHVS